MDKITKDMLGKDIKKVEFNYALYDSSYDINHISELDFYSDEFILNSIDFSSDDYSQNELIELVNMDEDKMFDIIFSNDMWTTADSNDDILNKLKNGELSAGTMINVIV